MDDPHFDPDEALHEELAGALGDRLAQLWDALDDLVTLEGPAGLFRLLADGGAGPAAGDLPGLPVFALADPAVREAFRADLADLPEVYSGNAGVTPLGGAMALVHAALRCGERQRCAAVVTLASASELHAVDQYDAYDPAGLAEHGDAAQAADHGLTDVEWRYGGGGETYGMEVLVTVGVAPGGVPALLVMGHDPHGEPGFDPLFAACREEGLRLAALLLDEL